MSHKYQVLLSLIPTAICSYLFPRVFLGQNKNDLKLGDAYLKYYELFFFILFLVDKQASFDPINFVANIVQQLEQCFIALIAQTTHLLVDHLVKDSIPLQLSFEEGLKHSNLRQLL